MATIRDVARTAGVSVATVSAVINRNKYVSPELHRRVEEAVRQLRYEPSRLGRALSLKRTHTLGFLVPTIGNPFFPSIVKAVEDVAFEHGYGLFVCNSEGLSERVTRYQSLLMSAHIDGLLISLTSELADGSVYQPFLKRGTPVVGLAGARTSPDLDCFVTDDVAGTRLLAEHLLSLGHRRLAFIGVKDSRSTSLRLSGLRQALASAGLTLQPDAVWLGEGYTESDGYRLAYAGLFTSPAPTALLCYNDVMAVGALRACNDRGLAVPADVSVVGYDDTLGEFTLPPLTTMVVPRAEMGHQAASLLLDRVEGRETGAPRLRQFVPTLKVRASSGSPAETSA